MTEDDMDAIADVMVELVKDALAPLEDRIAQLEQRPGADKGIWETGTLFRVGDITTHRNQGWVCREEHVAGATFCVERFRLFDRGARR